jgi:hypothetical protein
MDEERTMVEELSSRVAKSIVVEPRPDFHLERFEISGVAADLPAGLGETHPTTV